MTRIPHSTKSLLPLADAARLFAEIAADCSTAAFGHCPSEAEISDLAASTAEIFAEMRAAEADRQSQIEQPPAEVERKPHRQSISKMIEQAEQAGKPLASITLPDGTKLDFSKAEQQGNELDEWIAKHARAPERH